MYRTVHRRLFFFVRCVLFWEYLFGFASVVFAFVWALDWFGECCFDWDFLLLI
jgi:hypothetical protein